MTTKVAPGVATLGGLTVLIVEDDYLLAKEIAILLRDQGAKVLGPIPDAARARALVSVETPDCALLDINLKGRFVFEFAQELRDRGLPVIFITGYSITVLPDSFQNSPYLCKPFQPQALIAMVKQETATAALQRSGDAAR